MLARPGPLPSGSGWFYELKWDGFRADRLDRGRAPCSISSWVGHDAPTRASQAPHRKGPSWATSEPFDDGEALWTAVCEHGFEGFGGEEAGQPLPLRRARLDEAQESELLAARLRDRGVAAVTTTDAQWLAYFGATRLVGSATPIPTVAG